MSDRPADSFVRINPGQASVSLDLRNNTALVGCVTVDSDYDGRLIFVKKWPGLSSGESVLWQVLCWLNGAASLPERDDLAAHLDVGNLAAVDRILATEGVA